ncbi:MAG: DUF1491 family protein [Roseinatronobacter sp.]
MTARLTSDVWVSAFLRRMQIDCIPVYVLARGDAAAGSVLVKLALMNGLAKVYSRIFDMEKNTHVWQVLIEGAEADVDAAITRQRSRDPDMWVIEVEDARGRDLLNDMP